VDAASSEQRASLIGARYIVPFIDSDTSYPSLIPIHHAIFVAKIAVQKSSFYTLVTLNLFKKFPYKPDTL
jgi:hypothetical protein